MPPDATQSHACAMSSPTTRTYGVLYLIRCDQNGLHKIGITNNWPKRRRQLRVGETTTQVHVVRVNKAEQLERYLHRRFSAKRLPQSEWFTLDSEDLVFVRSVFLKAGSDYKAGGHKSPEVEPPAPPPPRKPEPPTPAQVRNSGVPEGWSDQQARAAYVVDTGQVCRDEVRESVFESEYEAFA
jgi:predicted GIY-YIG superfamily endonuclease